MARSSSPKTADSVLETRVMQSGNKTLDALIEQAQQLATGTIRHTTIASMCADVNYCTTSLRNLLAYARCHDYGVRHLGTRLRTYRKPMWDKIPLLLHVLRSPRAAFVFWHDADSLFTRPDISLGSLHPDLPAQQLTLSSDASCWLNSGHMMLRAGGSWLTALLRDTWDVYPPPEPSGWAEQSSLVFLLGGRQPPCRTRVHPRGGCCRVPTASALPFVCLRPQRTMNEYLRVSRHGWAHNFSWVGFILHFPGGSTGVLHKSSAMHEYEKQVAARWQQPKPLDARIQPPSGNWPDAVEALTTSRCAYGGA